MLGIREFVQESSGFKTPDQLKMLPEPPNLPHLSRRVEDATTWSLPASFPAPVNTGVTRHRRFVTGTIGNRPHRSRVSSCTRTTRAACHPLRRSGSRRLVPWQRGSLTPHLPSTVTPTP